MHVAYPDQAVPFDAVPDIVLHVEVHCICGGLPDGVQPLVAASERTEVGEIPEDALRFKRDDRQGRASVVQNVDPHETETCIPGLERAEPGEGCFEIAQGVLVGGGSRRHVAHRLGN